MQLKDIYRLLYVLIGVVGLTIHSGIFSEGFRSSMFIYYTNQSNLLCVVFFACKLLYRKDNLNQSTLSVFVNSPHTKFAVTMCITLTGIIYHVLLAPTDKDYQNLGIEGLNLNGISNLIVHYIIPAMTVLDWLLFDKKGQFKWIDPFIWLILPYLYFIFILLRAPLFGNIGSTSSRYPYGFIDLDANGAGEVAVTAIIITLIFVVLGYLLFLLDYLLGKLNKSIR